LTWLCLSLMLWATVAEATHNHARQSESTSCTICIVAHSSTPAPSCSHTAPVFAAVGLLQEKEVSAKVWVGIFDLGIRGPPVA
jgi:hypothetical protein